MEEEKMRALNSLNAGQSFKQQGKTIIRLNFGWLSNDFKVNPDVWEDTKEN